MGDRKARLAALAAKAGRTKAAAADDDDNNNELEEKDKSISFRNYVPKDPTLEESSSSKDDSEESQAKRQRIGESDAGTTKQSALQQALQEAQSDLPKQSTNINSGIPEVKKINWDLKRDIADKLAKLEKRTQRALVELLKGRLEREATEQVEDNDSDLD